MPEQQQTWRRMRRNHSNALPRYIIAYATETKNERHPTNDTYSQDIFHRGAIVSCRLDGLLPKQITPKIINSKGEFWAAVSKMSAANYTTWIVGHSVLYDMLASGIKSEFEESRLVVDWPRSKRKREDNNEDNPHASALVIINNPPTIIACRSVASGGRIVVVDLLNWFASSISDIEETVSHDREDWRRSIEGFGELNTPSMKKAGVVLSAFLRLSTWSRKHDMGLFRYTAASQAMSAYRHRFMTSEICIHDNASIKQLERDSFFGGRTELFKCGKFVEKVHQLDVNSLFPSVMRCGLFPTKLTNFVTTSRWSANLPDIQWGNCVATVWLKTNRPIYPKRIRQGIIYPIGEFETTICGEELATAHARGEIVSVKSWAQYETADIFTAWVDYMWQLRQNHKADGDTIYADLVKRMLNGLYGKFAQKSAVWKNITDDLAGNAWEEWTETEYPSRKGKRLRSFGYQLQEFVGHGELPTTFIAVSAFVTSAARMRMNSLRDIAQHRNVLYQGIDGLIVTDVGMQNLDRSEQIRESTIGYLRHQLTVDEGELLGYCDYRLGTKQVKSGLAGNAILLPDSELLQQIQHVSASLFSPDMVDGVRKVSTVWHREEMTAKGVADDDGVVWPFVLQMDYAKESASSVSVV